MSRSLRAALQKLRSASQGELAGSALSKAQCQALDNFARQTGSVQIQVRGRGVIYSIVHADTVERHWLDLTPIDTAELDQSLPARAANIGTSRSSKSAAYGHKLHYLLLKTASPSLVWRNHQGHELALYELSQQLGVAAMAIESAPQQDSGWSTTGSLWLVENQALFDRIDWLPAQGDHCVAYYSGQLRSGLIDWLAAFPRAPQVWFFPDYDGVGLLNYARIKRRLGDGVQIWLMPDWAARLQRYGNAALWQSTAREFKAAQLALTELAEPEIIALMKAMSGQGRALEQEAVWLNAKAGL